VIGAEDVRTRSALEETNEELRRVRKELARGKRPLLRFVVAGDPTKPVFTFTVPRRLLTTLGTLLVLSALVGSLVGWGRPARALGALSNAIVKLRESRTLEADEPLPKATYTEQTLLPTFQADAVPEGEHFTVEIVNTGKAVKLNLNGPAGEPDVESYRALRHELRCQRTGAESPIDPRLIELLHQIALESSSRIQIVSAFRAPVRPREVNYHTKGMAADIRVPGLTTAELRDLARALGASGVGYYPTVQFVHVDVRSMPFFWTDASGHADHSHGDDDQMALSEPGAASELATAAVASPETVPASPATPLQPGTSLIPITVPSSPDVALPTPNRSRLGLSASSRE
jgi:uncharacterized protein YcbK (DUF882 family)